MSRDTRLLLLQNIATSLNDSLCSKEDSGQSTHADILCGAKCRAQIERLPGPTCAQDATPVSEESIAVGLVVLDTLLALADEQINAVEFFSVAEHWLALYTDVSLLWALRVIRHHSGNVKITDDATKLLEAVRRLDMAIIVAGAQGPRRLEWIHEAIGLAQPLLPQSNPEENTRPAKRTRCADSEHMSALASLTFAPNPVPSLSAPPTIESYISSHVSQPIIIRGYLDASDNCESWPALRRWSDPEYILSRVGEGRHVPVEVGLSYDDAQWTQKIVPFRQFLRRAGYYEGADGDCRELPPVYLAQHSLFRQFPELERDMRLPDYVWSAPPVPADCPSYQPPSTHDGVIVNVWIGRGARSVVSPAHTDPYYNCYAQVLGQKRIWLAPPSCTAYMSPHGQAQASEDQRDTPDDQGLAAKYMSNTSTFPIFRPGHSGATLLQASTTFARHVWPHCMEAVLNPGDLLLMPPGWWHAMTGEGDGPGWSVSMWY